MEFAIISVVCFIFVLAAGAVLAIFTRPDMDELFGADRRNRLMDPVRVLTSAVLLLLPRSGGSVVDGFKKLLYLITFISFLVLFVTAFYPRIVLGEQIAGYYMMTHTIAGGVFAVCICLCVLCWADGNRFKGVECPLIMKFVGLFVHLDENGSADKARGGYVGRRGLCLRKIFFWIIAAVAPVTILTVVLSMLPVFGTHGQEFLLAVHRYSAVVFTAAAVLHTVVLVTTGVREMVDAQS